MRVEMMPVGELKPYENNAKVHTPEQVELIAASITKYGWDQPIVVDKDHVIIKGHGRHLAAQKRGDTMVPVLVRHDLTPRQVKAARIADNNVALGGMDEEKLKIDISALTRETAEEGTSLTPDDVGLSEENFMLQFGQTDVDASGLGITGDIDSDDPVPDRTTPKGVDYEPSYQVVVVCDDEAQQEQVYEMLKEQDLKVKIQSM